MHDLANPLEGYRSAAARKTRRRVDRVVIAVVGIPVLCVVALIALLATGALLARIPATAAFAAKHSLARSEAFATLVESDRIRAGMRLPELIELVGAPEYVNRISLDEPSAFQPSDPLERYAYWHVGGDEFRGRIGWRATFDPTGRLEAWGIYEY